MQIGHLEHDLFLLMLNLSQLDDQDRIRDRFVEALSEIWGDMNFRYAPGGSSADVVSIPISTLHNRFGYVHCSGGQDTPAKKEIQSLIRNAVSMLAILLENRQQARLLSDENLRLDTAVKQRTNDVVEANGKLREEIAERLRTEEDLRQSEERLKMALYAAHMDAFEYTPATGQIRRTGNLTRRWNLSAECLGREHLALLHPEDRQQLLSKLRNVTPAQPDYTAEYRICGPDGTCHWVEDWAQAHFDASGEVESISGVYMDISERRRAQEEREHVEAQLRQSQKLEALGTMAGGIAHDFNNILLAISGNAELAAFNLPESSPVQDYLGEITKGCARAVDLVRRILAFSRPQEQKREILDMQIVVEEALQLVRAVISTSIEFRTLFASPLPSIFADSTQIHQIIVNLATNAAHAIGADTGFIEFKVDEASVHKDSPDTPHGLKEGDYVRLSVSDTGCGMDDATLEHIFNPFFSTKEAGLGAGLGLSVVHGIMKGLGGGIAVCSEEGKGSTFRLFFPAAEGVAASPPVEHRAVRPHWNKRILYVDDDTDLVILMKRLLGHQGYIVSGYSDPVQALTEFRLHPEGFDAVVTDLSMPGLSGIELARGVIAVRPELPVIVVSGYVQAEDEEMARQLGIRELIRKPDTVEELEGALDRLFRHTPSVTRDRSGPLIEEVIEE